MLAPILGWGAATSTTVLVWPQVWLSCRHGRTLGLDATTCWVAVAINVAWTVYGLLLADPVQVACGVLAGIPNAAVLIAVLSARPQSRSCRALARTAWHAATIVTVAAAASVSTAFSEAVTASRAAAILGTVAGVTAVLALVPQPLALIRDRAQDLSGISTLRWKLSVVSGALWLGYGLAVGQVPVWAPSVAVVGASAVVLLAIASAPRDGGAPSTELASRPAIHLPCAVVLPDIA